MYGVANEADIESISGLRGCRGCYSYFYNATHLWQLPDVSSYFTLGSVEATLSKLWFSTPSQQVPVIECHVRYGLQTCFFLLPLYHHALWRQQLMP